MHQTSQPHTPSRFQLFLKSPFFITALIFVLVAIMLTGFGIYKYHESTRENTPITNLDSTVPDYIKAEVERQLYQNLVQNSPSYEDNLSLLTAKVRPNTFSADSTSDGEQSGTFIVDLEKLEQNYRVYYTTTSPDDFTVKIVCVEAENSHYPPDHCQAVGDDTDYDAYQALDQLLPYLGKTSDGKEIHVGKSLRYAYTNQPYLEIDVNSCGDEATLQNGLETFKSYLLTQDLPVSAFTFELRHQCYLQF